jgi:hypothetical protein
MAVGPSSVQGRRASHDRGLALTAVIGLVGFAVAVVLLVRYDVVGSTPSSNGVPGSGVAATQTRSLAAFKNVELAGSNAVTIRVGGKQSVVVQADDNLLRRVTTDVRAGSLVIGNTPGSFTARRPMRVEVSMPSLSELRLSGSGIISASGIKTSSLTVMLSGSGVLRASGSAMRVDVTLAGSGDAQLNELVARHVHAVVSGSGRILVTATKSLDASVPGRGAIVYGGNPPQVNTSIAGSGAVIRG